MEATEIIENYLAPSTWKENSPYWHHDHAREDGQKAIAEDLIAYIFSGSTANKALTDEECKQIVTAIHTDEDRMEVARMLIDSRTYYDFQPDYANLGQGEELERVLQEKRAAYTGLDAHIEAAQLEFACNLNEDYADVEDLIKLFD